MGAGNVKVLRKTLESFKGVVDEVVYGDMTLFSEDHETVWSYAEEFNMKIVNMPFNELFNAGFSSVLNKLIDAASNDLCLYMNTSEIIDIDYGINKIIDENPDCNAFFFTHASDPHRWFRCADRRELRWSGMIHESMEGEYRPYHKPIFQMADLPKDMDDPFKAKVFDTCKEIVYFKNYMSIIDNPETLGGTDPGWIKFATENYDSFKERLEKKGDAYLAYQTGDFGLLMNHFARSPEFMNQKFESNIGIEYQEDKKFLL